MEAPHERHHISTAESGKLRFVNRVMLSLAFVGIAGVAVSIFAQLEGASSTSPPEAPGVDPRLALHPDDGPWYQIQPSRTLVYHDCFDGLKCARLLFPLDWRDRGTGGPEVAIALIKRPAKVNVADPRYGGAIIMNPGGPGASGIQAVMQNGERIQGMADATNQPGPHGDSATQDLYFDVIGFDPRGVNHSVPRLDCFPNTFNRLVWTLESDAEGFAGSSDKALDLKWSRYQSRSESCMERINHERENSIAYYMGTRSVAEDIIAIAERHGEWRHSGAVEKSPSNSAIKAQIEEQRPLTGPQLLRPKEPILFWGTSYGTLLGAAVAALVPDRIHRMVLDSVLSPDFFFRMEIGDSLVHADKVFDQFVALCYKYGPHRCKFYRNSENAIRTDIAEVITRLRSAPLPVPATQFRGPTSITWTDLQRLIGRALYQPHHSFPVLAALLQATFEGNGSLFADYKAKSRSVTVSDAQDNLYDLSPLCKDKGSFSAACGRPNEHHEETLLGIQCGDGGMPRDMKKSQFRDYWKAVRNASSALGNLWSEYDMMCVGWKADTKWRFDESFSGETARPILFTGNRYDPVCPIENAQRMAQSYPGSKILQQEDIGHGILNSKSSCTEEKIRSYFQTGNVSLSDIYCEVDLEPFEGTNDEQETSSV